MASLLPGLADTDPKRLSKHVVVNESIHRHQQQQARCAAAVNQIYALERERDEILEELNRWRLGAGHDRLGGQPYTARPRLEETIRSGLLDSEVYGHFDTVLEDTHDDSEEAMGIDNAPNAPRPVPNPERSPSGDASDALPLGSARLDVPGTQTQPDLQQRRTGLVGSWGAIDASHITQPMPTSLPGSIQNLAASSLIPDVGPPGRYPPSRDNGAILNTVELPILNGQLGIEDAVPVDFTVDSTHIDYGPSPSLPFLDPNEHLDDVEFDGQGIVPSYMSAIDGSYNGTQIPLYGSNGWAS